MIRYNFKKGLTYENSFLTFYKEYVKVILHGGVMDIGFYLNEIGKYKLLTKEEEMELGYKILENDKKAIETLVNHNLRLVVNICKKYKNLVNGMFSFFDMIQEGNLALYEAASRFDITKGFKFSTYATPIIINHIVRTSEKQSKNIPITYYLQNKLSNYQKDKEELELTLNRKVTKEDLINIGYKSKKIDLFERLSLDSISLNMKNDLDEEILNTISDDSINVSEEAINNIISKDIYLILKKILTSKELEILSLRYGLNNKTNTLEEIAKLKNITAKKVFSIEKNALKKLKSFNLLSYLNGSEEEVMSNKKIYIELSKILSYNELKVISLRYGLDNGINKNFDIISYKLNIPTERVRIIEKNALLKIKNLDFIKKLSKKNDLLKRNITGYNEHEVIYFIREEMFLFLNNFASEKIKNYELINLLWNCGLTEDEAKFLLFKYYLKFNLDEIISYFVNKNYFEIEKNAFFKLGNKNCLDNFYNLVNNKVKKLI